MVVRCSAMITSTNRRLIEVDGRTHACLAAPAPPGGAAQLRLPVPVVPKVLGVPLTQAPQVVLVVVEQRDPRQPELPWAAWPA